MEGIEKLAGELNSIKWVLICIAVQLWGVAVYFLLKEIPKWWHSFDKKNGNFSWVQNSPTNVKFACIPNGGVSTLFNNEIIFGVKHYHRANLTDSVRIDHDVLKERYDNKGKKWSGFHDWKI